jgi:hypothetical protein
MGTAIFWVPGIEAVVLLLICYILLRRYADLKRTDAITVSLVVLGWFMAFSMIFAIPIDIYTVSVPAR